MLNKKIDVLSISYLIFLALLFLSGSLSGALSEVVYYLSFLVPLILAFLWVGDKKENYLKGLGLSGDGVVITLEILSPTVLVILLTSLLTSYLIFITTGAEHSVVIGDSLPLALLSHALLPALMEEMIFRYLPYKLLGSHSRRVCVLASATFFSFVHHSLFSIPYAFIAGVIFMTVTIATDSVIPAMIIHFVNNALSVLLLFYPSKDWLLGAMLIGLFVPSLVSGIFIFRRRKGYAEMVKTAFSGGEKPSLSINALLFIGISLFIAILSLR